MYEADTAPFDQAKASILEARIRRVFPPNEAPAGFDLAPDEWVDCPDCSWIREALSGRTWTSLSTEEIVGLHQNLSLLTPKGFHSFFPACLTHVLRQPAEWSQEVVMFALFATDTYGDSYFSNWAEDELRTVAAWVSFVAEHAEFYGQRKAEVLKGLQAYWSKYLD